MKRLVIAACAALAAGWPVQAARAHDGQPLAPHDLASAWNFDPLITGSLILAGLLYARGAGSLWRQAGAGRGLSWKQAGAFAGGLLALVVALISPLDALSEVLFSAHMTQHMLLVLVAAPLLTYATPAALAAWVQPKHWRRTTGRWWLRQGKLRAAGKALALPLVAGALHWLALVAWHVPVLYLAALEHPLVHILEHASFLVTAILFWWAIFHALRQPRRGAVLQAIFALFALAMATGLLGALITFSEAAWYKTGELEPGWGLSPLADQQLAGVIMWIPGGIVYLFALLSLLWPGLVGEKNEAPAQAWSIPELEREDPAWNAAAGLARRKQ